MREIKFRAWIIEERRMIYGIGLLECTIIEYDWARVCIGYVEGTTPDLYRRKCIPAPERAEIGLELIELMQYTGLEDKNGKEIYEGDIVSGQTSGPIEWAYGGWCVAGENPYLDLYADLNREIIGNIYENSELLEAGK